MKIVCLRSRPIHSYYGCDLSLVERLRRFQALGHEVSFHFLTHPKVPFVPPFVNDFPFIQDVLDLNQPILNQWKQVIGAEQADIYFVAMHDPDPLSFMLLYDPSKLWAYSLLTTYPDKMISAYQAVPRIFVSTSFVQNALQPLFPKASVEVLPNPCDYFKVLPSKAKSYWLLVNPIAQKGRDFVISIAQSLTKENFLFVKNWNKSDVQNLPSNVTLMEHQLDMAPIYANAKGVLMPSTHLETFGRVSMEAMMNGLPIISSNIGALSEVVKTGGSVLPLDVNTWISTMQGDLVALSKNAISISSAHIANCNTIYGNLSAAVQV